MLAFGFTSSVLNLLRQLQFQGSPQGCAGAELQGMGSSTSLVASHSKIITHKKKKKNQEDSGKTFTKCC